MVLKVLRECLDIEFEVDLVQSYLYWEACFARPNQYCMFPARLPDFSNLFYSSFSSVQKRKYKKSCFGSDAPGYESQHKTMRPGFITRLIPVDFLFQQNWAVWYQLGGLIPVRYQLGANRWGLPFNIITWFIGLGGSRILLHIWRTSAEKSAIDAFYGGTPTHLHSGTLIGFLIVIIRDDVKLA